MIKLEDGDIRGFYGCPDRSRRKESCSMLKDLAARSSIPWCVIGEFNDMMFMHEKKGVRLSFLLEGFKDTVYECGLMDLGVCR